MNQDLLTATIEGFLTSFTLIAAIGSQNAYVLKCSIRNHFPFYVSLTCFLGDFILINLGVFGLGRLLIHQPTLVDLIRWIGVAFITAYGCKALYNFFEIKSEVKRLATTIQETSTLNQAVSPNLVTVIVLALSFTFLNPHVYIDTVLLLGNLGIRYMPSAQVFFVLGCLLASAAWFLSLTLAGRIFSSALTKTEVWQVIELLIAGIMFYLAWKLAFVF